MKNAHIDIFTNAYINYLFVGIDLLGLSKFESLQGFLVELQVLIHLVLELSQLAQAQLGQINGLHLRLSGCGCFRHLENCKKVKFYNNKICNKVKI
jgi:hypothetical protein